jgi:hypothetical protein
VDLAEDVDFYSDSALDARTGFIPPIFDYGFCVDLTSGFVPTLAACAFLEAY